MTNGRDLSSEIAETSGWLSTGEQIDIPPDIGYRYASKIPGWLTTDDSSLSMYASRDGKDARLLWRQATPYSAPTSGFICWLDGGDVTGYPMTVFPVTVRSVGVVRSASNPVLLDVQFAVTAEPTDATIPAL